MNDRHEQKKDDLSQIEKWMEEFFLDPQTSFMDQLTFRIDLFETDAHIIVEALLLDIDSQHIEILLENSAITISVVIPKAEPCSRHVELPFRVADKRVHAQFANDILEVWISKKQAGNGKKRYIIVNG